VGLSDLKNLPLPSHHPGTSLFAALGLWHSKSHCCWLCCSPLVCPISSPATASLSVWENWCNSSQH